MARDRVQTDYVVFPPGPADAEALGRVHVAAWRQTYPGLLPPAYLARMSPEQHARRFALSLNSPQPRSVTLALADRSGIVGYAEGGPSRRGVAGEAEVATLYLLRGAQGHGQGARMIRDMARALEALGARSLVVSVLAGNTSARRFYERLDGVAEPERREPGPGGVAVFEVAYHWPDIARLTAD
jgi:ribosomal protein S18 acetylase RimI-like enzyme